MRTIFILMDSLNRHYLNAYGGDFIKTPNIDRLAEKSAVFDNHFSGSLPCMPARRELMTGRLNFMEAPWGPIEPWDDCLPVELRNQKKTYSHMITDHYHYFHSGGEAYHTLFDSWEFIRGQEGDRWHPLVKHPEAPEFKGRNRRAYWVNREFYNNENEEEYPTPKCFMKAMEFLDNNHSDDNWHLHLEVFDPHEPFTCPTKYREMYNDTWDKYHFDWPNYAPVQEDEQAVEHIKKSYAGTLTMADVWLGKLLDKMDELDMWKDTTIILTSDHGHLLGEHGYWAKNYMHVYNEIAQIPLMIYKPGAVMNKRRVNALTSSIDMMPTIMEFYGAKLPPFVHGKSVAHLLNNDESHHDAVLYGYFAKDINMFDGRFTYCRQPLDQSKAYHYTAMPRGFSNFIGRDQMSKSQMGVFLKHSYNIPHYRIECDSTKHMDSPDYNLIFDLKDDPGQLNPIKDAKIEQKLAVKMKELMTRYDAPESEFERVGLI